MKTNQRTSGHGDGISGDALESVMRAGRFVMLPDVFADLYGQDAEKNRRLQQSRDFAQYPYSSARIFTFLYCCIVLLCCHFVTCSGKSAKYTVKLYFIRFRFHTICAIMVSQGGNSTVPAPGCTYKYAASSDNPKAEPRDIPSRTGSR